MEVFEAIMTRRSVRKFKNKPVEKETVVKILEAAMNAPTAGNQQAWQFIVVTSREMLDKLAKAHPYADSLRTAPLAIAVCGDTKAEKHKDFWVQDCSAAVQNILLAAHAEGLGAVWLGVYPREDREKAVSAVMGLPDGVVTLALVAIGHPDQKLKPQKRYDESKIHYDGWNK